MPAWVDTPREESAWKRAKKAVARSRKKSEEDFSNDDFALVTHIAKGILKASVKPDKTRLDAQVAAEKKQVLRALQEVATTAGESIAALRQGKEVDASVLAKGLQTALDIIRGK
jgi:ribosomal protein L31E